MSPSIRSTFPEQLSGKTSLTDKPNRQSLPLPKRLNRLFINIKYLLFNLSDLHTY